jgi:hypothetical protein
MFVGAINGQTGAAYTQMTDIPININLNTALDPKVYLKAFMLSLSPENDFIGMVANDALSKSNSNNCMAIFINRRVPWTIVFNENYVSYTYQCFMHPTYINNKLGVYIKFLKLKADYTHNSNYPTSFKIEYPGASVSIISSTSESNISYFPAGSIIESDTNITTFLAKIKNNSDNSKSVIIEKYTQASTSPVLSKEIAFGLSYFRYNIDTVVNCENNKKVCMYIQPHQDDPNQYGIRFIKINVNATTADDLIEENRTINNFGQGWKKYHIFSDLLSRG